MATIALDPIWNQNHCIQRTVAGPCYPRISGTYTGTPDYIEAQIVNYPALTPYVPWFQLDAAPSNGVFSGKAGFPPSPQYLQMQVRFHNDPATNFAASAFVTGDLLLVTGQSCAQRFVGNLSGSQSSKAGAMSLFCTAFDAAAFGYVSGWGSFVGDGATKLANALIATTGVGVGFIFLGAGGVPLTKDGVGSASSTPLQYLTSMEGSVAKYPAEAMQLNALEILRTSTAGIHGVPDFAGIVHIHGEADGAAGVAPLIHFRGLDRYYKALRSMTLRTPDQCPFYCSIVGKHSSIDMQPIRQAMLQWASQTPGAVVAADRYDIPRDDSDGIFVHQSLAGANRMGFRYGMDINAKLGLTSIKGAGPRITRGVRNNNQSFTLFVDLNTHAGIAPKNAGIPLTGFLVSASPSMTSPIALSNATVTGGFIVLTTAGTFPTPSYVKFVPTAANSTDAANDNNVYSTNLATGDTQGLPLQPSPCAIIVA